jgi:hypothetical protein
VAVVLGVLNVLRQARLLKRCNRRAERYKDRRMIWDSRRRSSCTAT